MGWAQCSSRTFLRMISGQVYPLDGSVDRPIGQGLPESRRDRGRGDYPLSGGCHARGAVLTSQGEQLIVAETTNATRVERDGMRFAQRLNGIALRGLAFMYRPATREFVQTARGVATTEGPALVPEGVNLRYAAIAALGLAHVPEPTQREVLGGDTIADLMADVTRRALTHEDPGAVAIAAWAAAEVAGEKTPELAQRMATWLRGEDPLPTVSVAWMLTAAVAGRDDAGTDEVAELALARLLAAQGPASLFPHGIPARSAGRLRSHVGSFADQVYPVQALARFAARSGSATALAAANACAARICELQGEQGQWWWHYDVRDGSVVEPYPVYSVHQHAMAPMVLLDLAESGGEDHTDSARLGVSWLQTHPEVFEELVDDQHGVIWRKVGRRELRKAARGVNAATTSLRPGLRLPGLDALLPPGKVDRECRPYELGWLLYAWRRPSGQSLLALSTSAVGSQ